MEQRPRHNNHQESHNSVLAKIFPKKPKMWDSMLGLRTAYKRDFDHIYQSWLRGEQVKRRAVDNARDRKIFKQVDRWKDAEGDRPRLQPSEWAQEMIVAMAPF